MFIKRLIILFIFLSPSVIAENLKIALIYPMEKGVSSAMCISEAVINEAISKGLPVQLIKLDNGNSVVGSVLAAKRAIELQADVVIDTKASQETLAIAELFEGAQIPFLIPLSITQGKSYVMSLYPPIDWYAPRLVNYIVHKQKAKKVAIVTNVSLPYSQVYQKTMTQELKTLRSDIEVVQFEIIDGYLDVQSLVKKILASKADVLYLPLSFFQSAHIISRLTTLNPSIKIFMNRLSFMNGAVFNGEKVYSELQFLQAVSHTAPNMSISIRSISTDSQPQGPFKAHYQALVEKFCDSNKNVTESVLVYDNLMFILQVLKEDPTLRGMELLAKIKKRSFSGVMKTISFNKQGEAIGDYLLLTFKNGKITTEDIASGI